MFRPFVFGFATLCVTPFFDQTLIAADSGADVKLRENLRTTLLQLRTAQTERNALQAAKTQLDQEKDALSKQVAALTKQLSTDKDTADKLVAELKAKVEQRDADIGRLNESLAQWKAAQEKATGLANAKEAERAKLAAQVIELQRRVSDQQVKNAAMFKIGNEILSRYEKFGLGTALTAREPFVGTMRVKLENLVQDYGDKLSEQKIKP
jgi:chromosome segregation ATPase